MDNQSGPRNSSRTRSTLRARSIFPSSRAFRFRSSSECRSPRADATAPRAMPAFLRHLRAARIAREEKNTRRLRAVVPSVRDVDDAVRARPISRPSVARAIDDDDAFSTVARREDANAARARSTRARRLVSRASASSDILSRARASLRADATGRVSSARPRRRARTRPMVTPRRRSIIR